MNRQADKATNNPLYTLTRSCSHPNIPAELICSWRRVVVLGRKRLLRRFAQHLLLPIQAQTWLWLELW